MHGDGGGPLRRLLQWARNTHSRLRTRAVRRQPGAIERVWEIEFGHMSRTSARQIYAGGLAIFR